MSNPIDPNVLAPTERIINVDVPMDVAFNKEKMAKATASILERLGCANCHSGWDIRWHHIREFEINPATLEAKVKSIVR